MLEKLDKNSTIDQVMTRDPKTLGVTATIEEAARLMRDEHIGDLVVTEGDGTTCGVVTDRDLVVRAIAERRKPGNTRLGEICTRDPVVIEASSTIEDAVKLMAERSIRRVPVVNSGKLVGIVSLGDLAQARDPESALGAISAAPPTD